MTAIAAVAYSAVLVRAAQAHSMAFRRWMANNPRARRGGVPGEFCTSGCESPCGLVASTTPVPKALLLQLGRWPDPR